MCGLSLKRLTTRIFEDEWRYNMDLRRILGADLYNRAKRYAEQRFGNRKIATLIRIAVVEYLEKLGG